MAPPPAARVDAHQHLWDLAVRDHPWLTAAGMAPIHRSFAVDDLAVAAAAAGISRTVLVQVLPDPRETIEFLDLAARSELIGGVVGWVDLTRPDLADVLAALRATPGGDRLVGLRHLVQSEPDPGWLLRADVGRGLRTMGSMGLCFDLLTLPHQLPAAIELARALPETTFVLDHLSKPPIAAGALEPWASRIRELAGEANVFCKLSGMVTEADWASWTVAQLRPYAATVLEAFGPSRVMFGSDWPVCLLAASYDQVVAAAEALLSGLSPDERDQVFGGVAAAVYRLAGRGGH